MTCRASSEPLTPLFSLGDIHVSTFVKEKNDDLLHAPLTLGMGQGSGLVQLTENVPLDSMYRQYWYKSGTNETMRAQLRDVVRTVMEWVHLKRGDIVVDVGANDGTMLGFYPSEVTTFGFDPALNLTEEARLRCNVAVPEYFTSGEFFRVTPYRAKVLTSVAMFYDLEDPHAFVKDVYEVLEDDGIWVCQMSYTPLMLAQNAFDNICHEHLEYYTLIAFKRVVEQHGFRILDVELNNTNAGSFRVVLDKSHSRPKRTAFDREIGHMRVASLHDYEHTQQVHTAEPYTAFAQRILDLRDDTLSLLCELTRSGKRVMGYGASTKGNTLLQYYGIGRDLIGKIADRQAAKHGLMTVGTWIPIVSEAEVRLANPDYLFVLPWHFIDGFVERERGYLNSGGRFIVPLPQLEIIDGSNH